MQQKTFYKTFLEINLDPRKVKQALVDKRLTRIEKDILESYILIRNNQNSEALIRLEALAVSEFPFVEALKNLLIGISLNNNSYFAEAEQAIWKSIPALKSLESHYFLFVGYFNLCIIYNNSRELVRMGEMIEAMELIPFESELQHTRMLRCKFNYYSEMNNIEQAMSVLNAIEPRKSTMPEGDIISQLVFEFMFFVKQKDFGKCSSLLVEMKKFRKFNLTENFNFMKKMLHHLTDGGPIYAYQADFQNTPVLYHQIKVIQAMEEKNENLAREHWNSLVEKNANIYKNNFEYNGVTCLFSLCLEKHQNVFSHPVELKIQEGQTKLDTLIELLSAAKSPLSGPYIYEIIWGEHPVEKQDMNKLLRLIYRAKTERRISIRFRKGTYFIEELKENKKKVS